MSVSVLASLRPLNGACFASARAGVLSIRVTPRGGPSVAIRATVPIPPVSRRYSSKIEIPKNDVGANKSPKPVQQTPVSFRQFIGRLLAASLRNLGRTLTPSAIRKAYRDAPLQIGSTIAFLLVGAIFCAVILTKFFRDFYNPYFSAFPEPVANTLRRAIYYTNYNPDPELALKYYKRALDESTEIGMHPFSDEVLGIRIQVSAWLEKIGNYKSSIQVLEGILSDCTRWVESMEQLAADGKINAAGRLIKNLPPATEGAQEGKDAPGKETDDEPPETLWRTRERVLAKAVSISTKLGETYASEHVLEPEKSHEYLLRAVETTLKEFARRKKEGTRPGEQSWLTPAETGGVMESLGNDYERKAQFHLAIPLFFQALRLCDSPCHRATIMNNLAASFAQFPLYSPTAASDGTVATPEALKQLLDSSMPTSRQECLEAGLNWVRNAYQHGKDVKGEERTPECDEACAVALFNWGDIARMLGKPEMARKKYEQAIEMSNKLEFAEGVRNAQEGLKKLASATPTTS